MTRAPGVVAGIRIRSVVVPLDPPLRTANGTADAAPLILIDVVDDRGTTGHAYVFAYRPDMLRALSSVLEGLSAAAIGQPWAPRHLLTTLRQQMVLLGGTGLLEMGLAGLDIALWDLLARSVQQPLVRLLGGAPRPIRAYASFGMDTAQQAARRAGSAADAGFRVVKIKIGHPTLDEDLTVIRAVRTAIGPEVDLLVDYNQSLTRPEALRRSRALEGEGLSWIEEPLPADDLSGHAHLAEITTTPVQLGENAWGPSGIDTLLSADAGNLVMLDLVKVGGVSGWLNAAALCEAQRRPFSDHFYQEPSAHLMALSQDADLLEYYGLADPVLAEPLRVVDGHVTAAERPGNGIEWNEDAVAAFAVDARVIGTADLTS